MVEDTARNIRSGLIQVATILPIHTNLLHL